VLEDADGEAGWTRGCMGLGTVDLVDEFLERKFRAKGGMELGLDSWGDFGLFLKVVEETARKVTVLLREVR